MRRPLLPLVVMLWFSATALAQPPSAAAPSGKALADLSPEAVRLVMDDVNRALGVECAHCHVPERWADETKPTFAIARNMFRMVQAVNRQLSDIGEVSCWTCHGGQVKPSRLPGPLLDAEEARWPADLPADQKLTMLVYNVTLGVTCDHCHSTTDWKKADKPPMKMVTRMTALFDEFPKYMPSTARTQCYMCHKGSTKPKARAPKPGAQDLRHPS